MTNGKYDFNAASKATNMNEPIPPGIYKLKIYLRQGGAGEDGILRTAKNQLSEMLDFEFTVLSGSYAARKLWELWIFQPTADNDKPTDGLMTAIDITRSRIRAVLESARGIDPEDDSDEAKAKRKINDLLDLDGIVFVARVGIKQQTGYADKNVINEIVTLADKIWFSHMAQDQVRTFGTEQAAARAQAAARKPDFDDEIPF